MIINIIGSIISIIIFFAGIYLYQKSPRVRQLTNLIYDDVARALHTLRKEIDKEGHNMFNKSTLQNLQAGFQKGKLRGLINTDPSRLALTFDGATRLGAMKINTVRIRLDGKPIFSAGFGIPPHKTSYIMFTVAPNPHHYTLAHINEDLKPLKLQASLTGGSLLLISLVTEKTFFNCIENILKATKMLVR